jgi:hypothetical protein
MATRTLELEGSTDTLGLEDSGDLLLEEGRPQIEVVFDEHNPASWSGSAWTFSTVAAEGFSLYEPSNSDPGVRVDADIYNWSLRRGRSDELSQVKAGNFTASMHDVARGDVNEGHWAPSSVSATYSHFRRENNAGFENTHLGAPVSVYAVTTGGVRVQVFSGKINSWKSTYHAKDRKAVQWTATDGVADLSRVALGDGVMRNGALANDTTVGIIAYDSVDANGYGVCFNTLNGSFGLAAHDLPVGDIIEVSSWTGLNLVVNTPYWVVEVIGKNLTDTATFATDPGGDRYVWTSDSAHGLAVDDEVYFTDNGTEETVQPVEYSLDTTYWVESVPTTTTFRLKTELTSTQAIVGDEDSDATWTWVHDEPTVGLQLAATRNGAPISEASTVLGAYSGKAVTPPTFPAQKSGTRVAAIADCVNIVTREQVWPGSGLTTGARAIDLGGETMQANDEQTNVWQMLGRISDSEFSPGLFVSRDGNLTFFSRYTDATASGVVFGTASDTKIITYEAPDDMGRIFNQVTYYRTDNDGVLGGVPEKGETAGSQANFGIREMSISGMLNATDAQGDTTLASLAQWMSDFYAHEDTEALGELYFTPLTVITDVLTDAEQEAVFGLDIGDEVTIENGATDITQVVNSISMNSPAPGKPWTVKYTMTKAWELGTGYFRIDEGQIDVDTIAPG